MVVADKRNHFAIYVERVLAKHLPGAGFARARHLVKKSIAACCVAIY